MAKTYDVYFATNRDFNGNLNQPEFGERFNAAGPQYFRVGRARIERTGRDSYRYKSGEVEREELDNNVVGR
jgi:hypothetical protein